MEAKATTTTVAVRARLHWRQRSWIRRAPLLSLLLLVVGIAITRNNDGVASAGFVDTGSPGADGKRGVIPLTAKNFDSSLRDGNVWLIEFYAPWCGHCTRFASTYELVANQLHSDHAKAGVTRKVNVAKIDGAAERALSSRFDVHGFPSFYLVDGWTVREFKGNRSQEGLIQFALTGYEDTEPVPFVTGPFGPMGQIRSLLMRSGAWIVGLYENLTRARGMRPLIAMSVLCVGGLAVGLVSIVILGVAFLPKEKSE
ncbi:hypothetical protein ACHAW5_009279 [Stephanodiscus triporus]|uniref:Thioredoxin domain-containing protein n=1 Tax=Stephanodiscus triporus TaxID=2934178 RepID=A0ABD3N251_9STRA